MATRSLRPLFHAVGRNRALLSKSCRYYNTYPDPSDAGTFSQSFSNKQKLSDTKNKNFALDPKFKIDSVFPGIAPANSNLASQEPKTMVTVLPNGVTVASQEARGLMTSIIVLVKSGSGDENQKTGSPGFNTGVTQLLELTSFRGTEKHSAHDVSQKIEMFGGMMQCISSRENIIYCIDTLRVNAEQSIELMADSVIKPRVLQEDIDEAKEIIALQSQALAADVASREALHIAAYNGSPMGNVHLCPEDQLSHLNLALLEKFRKDHVFGSNIVVSGAGIDHDLFVDMVKTKFAAIPGGKTKPPRAKSMYTGGMHAVQRELREPFVKVAIGFEFATGWKDEKTLIAGIVLQTLLGGGSSFSAGGPGKGMYTRLYREVLNRYHWVESAESLLNIFDDSAMLAIDIACPEDSVGGSIQIIVTHFWLLATQLVTDEELNRAKNMAKSSLLMQLESRLVTCEDIARQVAVFGHRKDVLATCKLIDAVTPQDILDIGRRMLKSVPAVAVTGPNLQIPTFEAIHDYIKAKAASI